MQKVDRARRRTQSGMARILVVLMTLVVSLSGLTFGGTWLRYRLEHIVVDNATVKGRVHRVGARIDGQVNTVEVEPGQAVKKGQVLFRLQDDFLQASLRQCESELLSNTKRWEAEKLSIEHDRLRLALEVERNDNLCKSAAAAVEAAVSDARRWSREFDRITALIHDRIASASESDTVTTARDSANARLKAAQGQEGVAQAECNSARLALEGLKVREAALEVLRSDVERARQRLAAAHADVAATVIRAPEDGWVAGRIVEPGGSAKVGEPILSLWVGAPWIEAWVNEKHLSRIEPGVPVDITLPAFRGVRLRGHVESIGVLADKELEATPVPSNVHAIFRRNAKVAVRIAVHANHLRLQPGLSALVGIQEDARDLISVAPPSAAAKDAPPMAAALELSLDPSRLNKN